MIVNGLVVSYFLISLLSVVVILPASLLALYVGLRRRSERSGEEQSREENRAYLVISLLWLGFLVRLLLIPLWFLTLQSLIPSVPGAMCLAGLHLLDLPVSYLDTLLKLFLPLLYLYWLVLDVLDRREPSQPFFRLKLLLLPALALLTLAEAGMDFHFLLHIEPSVVGCCTSIFDLPGNGLLGAIRENAPAFLPLLLESMTVLVLGSALLRRPTSRAVALAAVVALAGLLLTLHTQVAPRLLEAPFHQCVFCLWQSFPDVTVASTLALTGLWLSVTCGLLPRLDAYPAARRLARRLGWIGLALAIGGVAEVLLRFASAGSP